MTAVQGDGAGFPDLVLSRRERLIFAELKAVKGRVAPSQEVWLKSLAGAPVEVYVWRPDEFKEIEKVLS